MHKKQPAKGNGKPRTATPEPIKREELRNRDPGKHSEIWANDMRSMFTPWDFSVTFGIIREASAERVVVDETTTVHLSPQFMVRVVEVLQKNIASYERAFGEIKMPSGTGRSDVDTE